MPICLSEIAIDGLVVASPANGLSCKIISILQTPSPVNSLKYSCSRLWSNKLLRESTLKIPVIIVYYVFFIILIFLEDYIIVLLLRPFCCLRSTNYKIIEDIRNGGMFQTNFYAINEYEGGFLWIYYKSDLFYS